MPTEARAAPGRLPNLFYIGVHGGALSRFEFKLNELRRPLLGSIVHDDNVVLTVFGKSFVRPKDAIHIIRAHQRLGARNFGEQSVELNFSFSFSFANDFYDLFEVRGMRRAARRVPRSARR